MDRTSGTSAVRGSVAAAGPLPVRVCGPAELSLGQAYAVLRLRIEVFVVEQDCPYPELDGRDLEPDCRWLWIDAADAGTDGGVAACARLLVDPGGVRRIGRVAVAPGARGRGLAGALIERCLGLTGSAEVVLDAQAHLVDWYARWGFRPVGAEFIEDGIPHRTMRRAGSADG